MQNKNIVALLGMAGFVVMADNWVVSPILPAIAENLHIDITRAGLLISAYMVPFGLFQLVFGPLADRFGKKQVITFSMILFTLATGLCALGLGLPDLALYRALTGMFAASVMPISLALIGDLFPIEKRQGAIGSFMGISFLGQGLSMAIGGVTAYFLSWRGVFLLYAVLSVIPTLALIKAYASIPSSKNPQAKFLAPYAKLLAHTRSLYTYILVLLEGIFIIGSFSYLGAYISETYHYNYLYIGLIMTAFGLASVIGGKLSGKLAKAMSPRGLLSLGLLAAVVAESAFAYLGSSLGWLIAGIALLGFGFIFTHSTLLTRATEFAMKARGAAMSLVAFCFMGGGGLGTALGGVVIQHEGFSGLFLIYGGGLFVSWLLSFALIRHQIIQTDELALEVAE
ncbi:MAG: MFS transporter [Proteobacteria bacterium]|nr:MFS transporter [Pseudomonadota bacterium]MBU4383284.1 MFS transporter [Pseudomonadota bacterium]MCG2764323.1 MFS transporter [Desulfarculaceae bacterium]